ncbi:uncharacterized protein LOC112193923 [Rosa chinensis]|nr:uncharacterized protein LOC112193923 [Rosa chinensis]
MGSRDKQGISVILMKYEGKVVTIYFKYHSYSHHPHSFTTFKTKVLSPGFDKTGAMGNCLVLQQNVTKIMKPDGKVLEYRASIKVYQVLSEFSGHAISEATPVYQHLRPDTKLLGGRLYYLVPLPLPSEKASQKKVRFSTDPEGEAQQETKVVRIKLVISKKQLQEMLGKGGVSVDDMVSRIQCQTSTDKKTNSSDNDGSCEGWKPVLESIPEVN